MELNTSVILTIINVLAGSSVFAILLTSVLKRKQNQAETANLIQKAAGELIDKYREHNTELITECVGLKSEVEALGKRVDDNETCQSQLTFKIADLEREKKYLQVQVTKLTEQVEALQEENKRLKADRELEKQILIVDSVG